MARYTEEFKDQIVRKMMPPNAQTVAQIHRDTGICEPTLYNWRNKYRQEEKQQDSHTLECSTNKQQQTTE